MSKEMVDSECLENNDKINEFSEIDVLKSNINNVQALVDTLKDELQKDLDSVLQCHEKSIKQQLAVLEELKVKHKKAKEIYVELESKYNEVEQEYQLDDLKQNLAYLEAILGYEKCRSEPIVDKSNSVMITLEYTENCYVKLIRNDQWQYCIHEIFPEHPNIQQLDQFLQESQDIKGFLCNLRKYFKFVLALADKK